MVSIIALTVAAAMKLLGAFLIDALLILPVLSASSFLRRRKRGRGIRSLFFLSAALGFVFSVSGYVISVAFDLPPGAVIALIAGIAYAAFNVI